MSIFGVYYILCLKEIYCFPGAIFKKKSIAIPMKGNMPDTIFKVLAKKNKWQGAIIFGCVRDSVEIMNTNI